MVSKAVSRERYEHPGTDFSTKKHENGDHACVVAVGLASDCVPFDDNLGSTVCPPFLGSGSLSIG
jgi:hypothetical protein